MRESDDLTRLLEIRSALNEAIKSQRRSDKCHQSYIEKTNKQGFSRSLTTTYNAAAAASNASALRTDMAQLKDAVEAVFHF
ncbi:hypothetical protein [Enterovibrio norvegicus]|uniref:hypothetical protein n=1 Tax=Enterovibrio norvegicus TaxID=188144 RepID=UPI00352DBAEA